MTDGKARGIDLVPLTALDAEVQMRVREIRNEEGVRKWMYTDHLIGEEEHRAWIRRLERDDRQLVFVVLDGERVPLGVVSVSGMDRLHGKTDWAYYLTASARGGLGSALEYAFLDFVFGPLGMEKLNCEVIEGNDAVVKLHRKFLFQEEGFRRSNILKNGERRGVHLLGLTRDDWMGGRAGVHERYRRVLDEFSVTIHWQPPGV